MTHEEWLAAREERRHEHIEIDREEVWEYYATLFDDKIQDGRGRFTASEFALDATLDYYEDRGLTAELLNEIIDDWSA